MEISLNEVGPTSSQGLEFSTRTKQILIIIIVIILAATSYWWLPPLFMFFALISGGI